MAARVAPRAARRQPEPAAAARVAHDQVPRRGAVPAPRADLPAADDAAGAADSARPDAADGQLGGARLVPLERTARDRRDPELRAARDDDRRGEGGAPDLRSEAGER